MTSSEAITGLELSERYFIEIVKPLLNQYYPDLRYSCGLIGTGSEVLGFDDITSQDHDWGPRLILFLTETDHKNLTSSIDQSLRKNLPHSFHDYSTSFSSFDSEGVRLMVPASTTEVSHNIRIVTVRSYFDSLLGIDIYDELSALDWLSFPQQILLSIRSGRLFHDELGLSEVVEKMHYYPKDIRLYMIASSWQRIGQEEHLAARAMLTNQAAGFSIISARLARDIMQLGFLLERKYAPYAKWLEKAFIKLNCAKLLRPHLNDITNATCMKQRQLSLCRAFEVLAVLHNELAITKPVPAKCRAWHNRGFNAIHGEEIALTITDSIAGTEMQSIIGKGLIGNIDQLSDNTDLLANRIHRRNLVHSVFGE